jgi:hypothetical protein
MSGTHPEEWKGSTMKKSLLIAPAVLGLLVSLAACSASAEQAGQPAEASSESELAGVWQMTALEAGTEGNLQQVPYSGQIVFTSDTMSVQAMNPDTAAPDSAYTVQGYEAYYGDLTVDADAGTFDIEIESAAARDLIGQTFTRNFDVTEDTLVLTPADPAEGWRVTYERISD